MLTIRFFYNYSEKIRFGFCSNSCIAVLKMGKLSNALGKIKWVFFVFFEVYLRIELDAFFG